MKQEQIDRWRNIASELPPLSVESMAFYAALDALEAQAEEIKELRIEAVTMYAAIEEAYWRNRDVPEINMGNYDDEDVSNMNSAMCDIYHALKPIIEAYETDSKSKPQQPNSESDT